MFNQSSMSDQRRNSFTNKNWEKPSPFQKVLRKSSENNLEDDVINCKFRKYSDNRSTNVNRLFYL